MSFGKQCFIFLPVEQRVLFLFTTCGKKLGKMASYTLYLWLTNHKCHQSCLCQTVSIYYNKLKQCILVVYVGRYNLESFVFSNKRWMYFDHLRREGFSTHFRPSVLEHAAVKNNLPVNFRWLQIRPSHCYSSGASLLESHAF